MRHAIVGAGAVGGIVGGALARSGQPVTLVVRSAHPPTVSVSSVTLGEFEAPVAVVEALDSEPVDVTWLAVKATALPGALDRLPPEGLVVPLLNGVDHVALLRETCGAERVVAGTISVQAVREAPGRVAALSPFIDLKLAARGSDDAPVAALAQEVSAAGLSCEVRDDEATMLWEKLCFLAPLALCTTAADRALGGLREDAGWLAKLRGAVQEACAVGRAEGADVSADELFGRHERGPETMRSSMQGDVQAGRAPELDAIAGPILRGGARHGIPVPVVEELAGAVRARASQ
jgi:2-dehydropantoate 2-reductase